MFLICKLLKNMISHFLRVFIRSLAKNSGHSVINIFGLVVGMTSCLLITLYAQYENSFDDFHVKKDNIYRVRQDRYTNGQLDRSFASGPMGIGDDLKANFPEVVRFTRVNGTAETMILANGDVRFKERGIFFASEDFFEVFSHELIEGSTVFKDPFTMIVTESLGKKYFGDASPIGKTIKINGKEEYTIVGVIRDTPGNTHLKFNALLSFVSLHKILGPEETEDLMTHWGWIGNWTYVELQAGTDLPALDVKVQKYVNKETEEYTKVFNEKMAFVFQPLTSIHLNSDLKYEVEAGGNQNLVNFLQLIAVFVLVISWINYVNLSTAKSLERAREVGVRKILGTKREHLVIQFIAESFLLKAIALLITIGVAIALLPWFSGFVGRELTMEISWPMIAVVFMIGVLAAGLYPAIILSGFKPSQVLKGTFRSSKIGVNLRRGLVGFQFVASIILVTATLAVYSQIRFMQQVPLGIEKEGAFVVEGPNVSADDKSAGVRAFKESMKAWPFVESVTASTDVPGSSVRSSNGSVRLDGQTPDEGHPMRSIQCDENFVAAYGLTMIAGRNFTSDKNEEWKSVIVNESAMKLLGISDPQKILGRTLNMWDHELKIVGVMKDYHHESLKTSVDQIAFICDRTVADYLTVKFSATAGLSELIDRSGDAFHLAFPENTYHFFFMDEYFDRQYRSEATFNKITGMFAVLAALISCLGLLGLSSYMIIQRTKEIGIRKVLGATVRQIVMLMSKEYVIIIIIANVISSPISWMLMNEWLTGFAYRIDPGIFLFLVPGIGALAIAVITIASQSLKAAAENPSKTLRSE